LTPLLKRTYRLRRRRVLAAVEVEAVAVALGEEEPAEAEVEEEEQQQQRRASPEPSLPSVSLLSECASLAVLHTRPLFRKEKMLDIQPIRI
jgi:hypothetical protein